MNESFIPLYKEKSALFFGSPFNGVFACLFLEFLEYNHYKFLLPKDSYYFRNILYYIYINGIMT